MRASRRPARRANSTKQPADLFVADFIGDANILTGVLGEQEGPHARVQIGGLSVRLPHRGVKPGRVKLAVRPDAIVLNDTASASPSIRGVVTKASYLGTQMEYEVETPAGNLFVVQYGSREPIPGYEGRGLLRPNGVSRSFRTPEALDGAFVGNIEDRSAGLAMHRIPVVAL